MDVLAHILVQFIVRLSFGIAIAMGATTPRLVTSGYFRIHLWVVMGLNTLAALVVFSSRGSFQKAGIPWQLLLGTAVLTVVLSYAGAVTWLYERARAGRAILMGVGLLSLASAFLATNWGNQTSELAILLAALAPISGGMLLGATLAAMFLGHWYLNSPTMQLAPLQRLIRLMAYAVAARAAVSAVGLFLEMPALEGMASSIWVFVALRWLAGLVGTAGMAWMAWQTLKVPNTQSTTGILYAGVILAFIGELMAQLLSVDLLYPL